ncbi:MAG: response regulator, partial [Chloroflexota bacterium]
LRQLLAIVINEITGLRVEALSNGEEALVRLEHSPLPSAVLVDMMMPIVDGYQLLAELKPRFPSLPAIAMSAADLERGAYAAGCDDFLAKPFEIEELRDKLMRWLPAADSAAA